MSPQRASDRRDVVTRVRHQHDNIGRLFADVAKASRARRAEAFPPLVRLLAVHETAEETVIYPALLWGGTEATEVVRLRRAEEDQAKKALADLEGMDPASDRFDEAFTDFRADVEAHIEAEESEVLPRLDEARSRSELRMMDMGFVFVESIAPTHAHRMAPEGAVGNLMVGPVIGMFDRMRDMLDDSLRRARGDRRDEAEVR